MILKRLAAGLFEIALVQVPVTVVYFMLFFKSAGYEANLLYYFLVSFILYLLLTTITIAATKGFTPGDLVFSIQCVHKTKSKTKLTVLLLRNILVSVFIYQPFYGEIPTHWLTYLAWAIILFPLPSKRDKSLLQNLPDIIFKTRYVAIEPGTVYKPE